MSARQVLSLGLATLLAVAVGGFSNPVHAGSVTAEIKVDSSGMVQGSGGLIDIQLSPAYPPGSPSVSVVVNQVSTDGSLGAATPIQGTAAGDLTTPGGVTANNTAYSELTQSFTVASFFDVFVTLSGPEVGSGAVGPFSGTYFYLYVLDRGTGTEWASLQVNPDTDTNGMPIVNGKVAPATSGPQVQVILQAVPEPSGIVLMSLGLGAIVGIGRLRKTCAAA